MKDMGSSLAMYNPTEIINIVGFHETEEFFPILYCLDPKSGMSPSLNTCEIYSRQSSPMSGDVARDL